MTEKKEELRERNIKNEEKLKWDMQALHRNQPARIQQHTIQTSIPHVQGNMWAAKWG